MDGLLPIPHIGAAADGARRGIGRLVANLEAHLDGRSLPTALA